MKAEDAKILIVEDNEDARFLLNRALALEGYCILEAPSGPEALQLLTREKDVALLMVDLSLPGMDGAEFIGHVRRDPILRALKVVVVSGWDDLAAKARAAHADGYLRKPIEMDALYKEVQKHIQLDTEI